MAFLIWVIDWWGIRWLNSKHRSIKPTVLYSLSASPSTHPCSTHLRRGLEPHSSRFPPFLSSLSSPSIFTEALTCLCLFNQKLGLICDCSSPEIFLFLLPCVSFLFPLAKGDHAPNHTPQRHQLIYLLIRGGQRKITQLCFLNKGSRGNWGSLPILKMQTKEVCLCQKRKQGI